MFVSDVQVLRRFAKKLASVEMKDPSKMSPSERAEFDKNYDYKAKPPHLDDKINMGARAAGSAVSGAANKGLEGITGAAKSLYNNATPTNLGLAAAGAGLGGGALYGLSRLLQSEEDRKKKTPVLAPALGALGGAVTAPMLAALIGRYMNPSNGPAMPGDVATMDALGHGTTAAPPTKGRPTPAPIA